MTRIVVVDARLLLYNLHHRRQSLLDFKAYTQSLLKDYKYSKIIYAFDIGKSKRRVKLYPEYKTHRKEKEKKLSKAEQTRLKNFNKFYNNLYEYLLETGEAIGIDGVEADDIANIVVDRFANTDTEVLLLSSDADWCFNLKAPNIKLLHVQREVLVTQDNIEKHFDFIDYREAIDYQIYAGSAKENVTGVVGLGKKRFLIASRDDAINTFDLIERWVETGKYGCKLPDEVSSLFELYERNREILSPYKLEYLDEDEQLLFKQQFNSTNTLSEDEDTLLQLDKFGGLLSV